MRDMLLEESVNHNKRKEHPATTSGQAEPTNWQAETASRRAKPQSGEGLPGRVWRSRQTTIPQLLDTVDRPAALSFHSSLFHDRLLMFRLKGDNRLALEHPRTDGCLAWAGSQAQPATAY